jgi:hypothetical protein
VVVEYIRKHVRLFNTQLNILTLPDCFEVVTTDGGNTILLIPEAEIDISEELEGSISKLASEEIPFRRRGGSEVVNDIG